MTMGRIEQEGELAGLPVRVTRILRAWGKTTREHVSNWYELDYPDGPLSPPSDPLPGIGAKGAAMIAAWLSETSAKRVAVFEQYVVTVTFTVDKPALADATEFVRTELAKKLPSADVPWQSDEAQLLPHWQITSVRRALQLNDSPTSLRSIANQNADQGLSETTGPRG